MAAPNLRGALSRVQEILEETRAADTGGALLHERDRRKAYQAGIERALVELRQVKLPARQSVEP